MKFKIFMMLVLFLSQIITRKLKKNHKKGRFEEKECYLICQEEFPSCLEATVEVAYTTYKTIYNQSLYCNCFDRRGNRWQEKITDYPFRMVNEGSDEAPKWICD